MSCENCDYTDIIMPLDYDPRGFDYANRKRYDLWRMVGMQVSHPFVGGIKLDSSGRYKQGIAEGCLPVEEINQHNHIIGRGTWYFRSKSDSKSLPAYDGEGNPVLNGGNPTYTNSAAYGIMGHCQSPGIEDSNGPRIDQTSPFVLEDDQLSAPIHRGWGLALGTDMCSCAGSTDWHLAVFIKNNATDELYMEYTPDEECKPEEDAEVCAARNSRLPGRFSARLPKQAPYRTCEAKASSYIPLSSEGAGLCAINPSVIDNGITGESPFFVSITKATIIVKLTSLPSCKHFDKVFYYGEGVEGPGNMFKRYRCERGVIRIAPACLVSIGNESSNQGQPSNKMFHYDVIEEHFDRWDIVDGNGSYKIYDELFTIKEFDFDIRVLAHSKAEIMKYFKEEEGYDRSTWMTKKYLTGGKTTDSPSGKKGCVCRNNKSASAYPVRPYNNWSYCANNFSCLKTCDENFNE